MEENVKLISAEFEGINTTMSFDVSKLVIAFKDNGWHVSAINIMNKEIIVGGTGKAATFVFSDDKPYIVFRSTVDGDASTCVKLSPNEMAVFSAFLTFDFGTLASIFLNMN